MQELTPEEGQHQEVVPKEEGQRLRWYLHLLYEHADRDEYVRSLIEEETEDSHPES